MIHHISVDVKDHKGVVYHQVVDITCDRRPFDITDITTEDIINELHRRSEEGELENYG